MTAPSFPSDLPDLLLRGGTVLTLDAAATVLAADVRIEGGRIAALGPGLAAPPRGPVVDVSGCLVLPGADPGHVHLGQTFFRGLAEGRRSSPALAERIWRSRPPTTTTSAYWCALLGRPSAFWAHHHGAGHRLGRGRAACSKRWSTRGCGRSPANA